jgi:cytoskeletal protein RodZ
MSLSLVLIMLMAAVFPLAALWFANHFLGNEIPEDPKQEKH